MLTRNKTRCSARWPSRYGAISVVGRQMTRPFFIGLTETGYYDETRISDRSMVSCKSRAWITNNDSRCSAAMLVSTMYTVQCVSEKRTATIHIT